MELLLAILIVLICNVVGFGFGWFILGPLLFGGAKP